MKHLSQFIDQLQLLYDSNSRAFIGVCILIVIAVSWLGHLKEQSKGWKMKRQKIIEGRDKGN